ncbi:MAG: metallophosphoesterase family protein [Candidatus Hodarchaeales archaeon]|jgi:Icc-related predicted phosphoesterase
MVISFQVLILADIHGNLKAARKLVRFLKEGEENIDLIIIAGDLPATTSLSVMARYMITHPLKALSKRNYTEWVYKGRGRKYFTKKQINSANEILNVLSGLNASIIYIPGNVDTFDLIKEMERQNRNYLDIISSGHLVKEEYLVIGVGGAIIHMLHGESLCDHEYSVEEYSEKWKNTTTQFQTKIAFDKNDKAKIIVSHESPLLEVSTNGETRNIGSEALSTAIHKLNPDLVVFGHFHEFSFVQRDENVTYINPGPLACYYYALVTINGVSVDCSLKRLQPAKLDSINKIYQKRTVENIHPSNIRVIK